ncbi:MAG: competence/damage-inducible protein A [Bacteroidota bacterium]|nr:competence/damage-inducible protein A [Bacteroidota bacterium]
MKEIIAEIITVGDEILIGQIVDTNSAWLGSQLSEMGIRVKQISSVSDNAAHILNSLKEAATRADLILITGGLGPTKDDITKNTLAQYFHTEMVLHPATLRRVEEIFSTRNLPMLDVNHMQAYVPANCTVVENSKGTAPGMWFDEEGKVYMSMPGVPSEMKSIFTEGVIAKLHQRFIMPSIRHRTLLTAGIGESFLAEKIKDVENKLPEHIKLAYLPGLGQVRLRLTGYGEDANALDLEIANFAEQIKSKASSYFYGEGDDTLGKYIGRLFAQQQWTLSIAESFTGGYISHLITEVPGSSSYFVGALVAYDNEVKIKELGVHRQTIIDHGSVSEQTIIEMAEGCRKALNTHYAIATSGVAGPEGGTEAKPIGTCWIAIACPDGKTIAKKYHMGNDRHNTILRSGIVALDMLRKVIEGL